jgi:hypothetical protein
VATPDPHLGYLASGATALTRMEERRLPTLVIVGARKSGTTSLHGYLGQHPDVFMSKPSELHFFDDEDNWAKGVDWYASHFDAADGFAVRGEKTPMYSAYPYRTGIPARVASVIPDTKLIYLLRDPIARIRSDYVAAVVLGFETLPFAEAMLERCIYTDVSRYAMQVEQWLAHFDRDQLLLLTSEQLWQQHEQTMAEVFRFLGVDADFVPEPIPANVTKSKVVRTGKTNEVRRSRVGHAMRRLPEPLKAPIRRYADRSSYSAAEIPAVLTPELRDMLANRLRTDIEHLKTFMPPDFDAWGIC